MDCYPDFSQRMAKHTIVNFHSRLPRPAHLLARKFISLYGRAPDELGSWVKAAEERILSLCPNLEKEVGMIASFGEPMSDHLLGLRLKKRTGLPWLAHFSDPWSDNPFRKPFFVANAVNKRLEREVITKADKVVFTSEETRALVMRKYPTSLNAKTAVLPHSFEERLYPSNRVLEEKLTIRYLGTFYADRTPLPLLEALVKMISNRPESLDGVQFEFIGGVAPRILRRASRLSLPAGLVHFKASVGYSESLRLMKNSDLLLVVDAPSELSVFLPSKLVDYIGAGVPIMGVVPPGSSANLIRRVGGSVADPKDQHAIIEVLNAYLQECREIRGATHSSRWGDSDVRGEYAIGNVREEFAKLLAA